MDDGICQYKLQPMVASVLDGNVFLVTRALSTNKRNIFSIIGWKCIFLFTSWPLDRVHYELGFDVESRVKRLLKKEIGIHIHMRNTYNISALLPMWLLKQRMERKGKTFCRYKRIQQFYPEFIEQNLSEGFPEITFCTEVQRNKRFIHYKKNSGNFV